MRTNIILTAIIVSIVLAACTTNSVVETKQESEFIEITKAQFETEKMVLDNPSLHDFDEKIHFTGHIVPSTDGKVQISLLVPGIVKSIFIGPGHFVKKGDKLYEIEGHEVIEIQKNFAESAALLLQLEGEFERIKELYEENIGSKKDFLQAQSAFKAEKANYETLKIHLHHLGLNTEKIKNGEFKTSYTVFAPISGNITYSSAIIGQYVNSENVLSEIIDTNSLLLQLSVYEKDMHNVTIGQKVIFSAITGFDKKSFGEIISIGKSIEDDTKSLVCYARIHKMEGQSFINNQYIEGNIIASSSSLLSVPETAILKSEEHNYILILEKEDTENYYFKKQQVKPGKQKDGMVELTEIPKTAKILVSGGYNIVVE